MQVVRPTVVMDQLVLPDLWTNFRDRSARICFAYFALSGGCYDWLSCLLLRLFVSLGCVHNLDRLLFLLLYLLNNRLLSIIWQFLTFNLVVL